MHDSEQFPKYGDEEKNREALKKREREGVEKEKKCRNALQGRE